MGNRTGTYMAFDGLGKVNPTQSDFRYYATIQGWAKNNKIDFQYTDSHKKTFAVRDSSALDTLKSRIRLRLSMSKNLVIILSSDTRKSGSLLSYEIEQAVDVHNIPLIIAYVDYDIVAKPAELSDYWPTSLKTRINNGTANAIHIGFKKEPILDAIGQFYINGNIPSTSLNYYTQSAYDSFGIPSSLLGGFSNKKKVEVSSAQALYRLHGRRL